MHNLLMLQVQTSQTIPYPLPELFLLSQLHWQFKKNSCQGTHGLFFFQFKSEDTPTHHEQTVDRLVGSGASSCRDLCVACLSAKVVTLANEREKIEKYPDLKKWTKRLNKRNKKTCFILFQQQPCKICDSETKGSLQ